MCENTANYTQHETSMKPVVLIFCGGPLSVLEYPRVKQATPRVHSARKNGPGMIPQNGRPPSTFSSPRSENALEYGLGAASVVVTMVASFEGCEWSDGVQMGLSENRQNPYTQWFCWSLSLLNGCNWGYIPFSDILKSAWWLDIVMIFTL